MSDVSSGAPGERGWAARLFGAMAGVVLLLASSGGVATSATQSDGSTLIYPKPAASTAASSVSNASTLADTENAMDIDYLDDRTTAASVVRSYYNAVNRQEYARAYSYWAPAAAESHLAPFPEFKQGYARTESVALAAGSVITEAGAGQIYYALPVTLRATLDDGTVQTFVGCYQLHLANPAIQAEPPFRPMSIIGATVQQVPTGADTNELMPGACSR